MAADAHVAANRSVPRRRRGIGGSMRWAGRDVAATPFVEWKNRGGGSARKLAASLWRLSFDRFGFEFCSSATIPKFANEEVTKWDYCNSESRYDNHQNTGSEMNKLVDIVRSERKNSKMLDAMNSKLLRDIAEAKSLSRRYIQKLEKEKKARAELKRLCEDLAKEIKGNKAQIRELRNQQRRIESELEEERKMLQLAEVWKEGQAQMKIADAKLILEDKYAQISNLIADVTAFLRRLNLIGDVNGTSEGRKHLSRCGQESKGNARNQSEKSEAREISSVSLMQLKKKGPSAHKTCKKITIDGNSDKSMSSTICTSFPQRASRERELEVGRNPHVVRAMEGHIEWPRRTRRRGVAANLLEAKITSQKTLLRNLLKQRS